MSLTLDPCRDLQGLLAKGRMLKGPGEWVVLWLQPWLSMDIPYLHDGFGRRLQSFKDTG